MKTLNVPANRMIRLPKHLFRPADKIALVGAGGVLIIKKLEMPRLSSIAGRVRERALPMRAIVREVHAYRRAQRTR